MSGLRLLKQRSRQDFGLVNGHNGGLRVNPKLEKPNFSVGLRFLIVTQKFQQTEKAVILLSDIDRTEERHRNGILFN